MEFPHELEAVEGATNLRDWFGYWPSFHDAEVIELLCYAKTPSSGVPRNVTLLQFDSLASAA